MVKSAAELDVLVLGSHPCASLAAALLRQNTSIRVMRAGVPGERVDDRLCIFNAQLFELHPLIEGIKSSLEFSVAFGLRFLADDPVTRSEYEGKSIAACVSSMKPLRSAFQRMEEEADVERIHNRDLTINHVDEAGVDLTVDDRPIRARLLVVAGDLPSDQRRILGIPESWEPGVLSRYTYVKCKASGRIGYDDAGSGKTLLPMSLDLNGQLTWAWAMHANGSVQFAVEQPLQAAQPQADLLRHWLNVLEAHGVIKAAAAIDLGKAVSLDLPFAGALAQEGVADHTLLIGPAGGFYTACAEEVYPACWSAMFAADVARKALKEKHLQDALQSYRHKWGSTLGDYLRGPQQNLRFLLPLVYKNKVMAARLAEAILFGKSVVR